MTTPTPLPLDAAALDRLAHRIEANDWPAANTLFALVVQARAALTYRARVAELEQRERDSDKAHACQVARVETLLSEKAELEAERDGYRNGQAQVQEVFDGLWKSNAALAASRNALRDALNDALDVLNMHGLPEADDVGGFALLNRTERNQLVMRLCAALAAHPAASLAAHDAEVIERGCRVIREVRIAHAPEFHDDDQGPFLHGDDVANMTRAIKERALAAQERFAGEVKP